MLSRPTGPAPHAVCAWTIGCVEPEPRRPLPGPAPGTAPDLSADLELLERTLRERLPGAMGATEEEIAATEARRRAVHEGCRGPRL